MSLLNRLAHTFSGMNYGQKLRIACTSNAVWFDLYFTVHIAVKYTAVHYTVF